MHEWQRKRCDKWRDEEYGDTTPFENIGLPCKDCQKRHEKCHGSCDQYKNWDAEQKKLKEEMWKERKSEHEADERKKAAVRNYIRRKKQR